VITYGRMSKCEWQGDTYDRVSGPQKAFGEAVLGRLRLDGGETVLDAGCGSGRVTELLLARLPRGRVIAVDQSESMLETARRRLGGRVQTLQADLCELRLAEPVDAILSTATFHWISDHQRLFERLHASLRAGGQLVAQCGGETNIDVLRGRVRELMVRAPYAEHFRDWTAPWNYAGAEITRERLLAAGFAAADCWLAPAPVTLDVPRVQLAAVVLGPHVQHLPEPLRDPFMDDVIELLGDPVVVDYVRLNIDALA
jgi:trans-aconitate 2-methyltransferase